MSQSFTTDQGTLVIPGAYSTLKVQQGAGGLSTTGVIFLVGEADGGPDFTQEVDLSANAFGPTQLGAVVAKYKSGPLVDTFRAAATPANDADIVGSPNRFVIVKTNPGVKASSALPKVGGGTYATLYDQNWGQLGNLIYYTITAKTAEVVPTTGAWTYIPAVGTVNINLRQNGDVTQAVSLAGAATPTTFVADVHALGASIDATGGANRAILTAAHGSLTLAVVAGNTVTITLTGIGAWDATPLVGDSLQIPSTSAIAGGANQNVGGYVVTAASATVITATKLSDAQKPGAVVGTITAPAGVGPFAVAGASTDLVGYTPVTVFYVAGNVIDGLGKDIEVNDLATGTDLFSRVAYQLGTTTPVTWLSVSGTPALLTSTAEYQVSLNTNRQVDNVQEQLVAGGQIALKLGCKTTGTCVVVVGPTTLTTTVTGTTLASNLSVSLKSFPTLADLAVFLNAQPGYQAAVGTTSLGQLSPLALDEGTFHAATNFGNFTLRLKVDAVKFFQAVSNNSALVQLGNPPGPALAGLPATLATTTFLSGGARGATTDAVYDAGIDALKLVFGNFLVPCFSRDASADIADGLTDSGSTYTIANIQAYARTHVLQMSTLKKRKFRQAFLAQRDTFANVEAAASTLSSERCALAFQDVKVVGGNGILQAQPHVLAALAAGTQAAGFYKAIVHKGINCNGVLQAGSGATPDFKDADDDQVENALNAGLLVAKKNDDQTGGGGFFWVSDQTTYSRDNNFVFNSIQAMYVADTIRATCSQRMEKSFVGQSVADISAALALANLEAIMADFLRLKLITFSDDAPKGFKNAVITISGAAMKVSVEVKLAGALYFIVIDFLVSPVQQTAAQ